jgi:hypothetical protein
MKILLFFLLPLILSGQDFKPYKYIYISTELDIRSALTGNDIHPPAYDGIYSLGLRNKWYTIQANFENFAVINFKSFGFSGGYVWNYERAFQYVLTGGLNVIHRKVNWLNKEMYPSAQISGQFEFHLDKFAGFMRGQSRYRGDLSKNIWSVFLGIKREI